VLHDAAGERVGLVCELGGGRTGSRLVLDACVDTAPFGDESAWTHPPTSAAVADGWLWGRGAADSKAGAAIFCHLLARLAGHMDGLRGGVSLLLDADEHTGAFGGARAYFTGPGAPGDVLGVMIGYPGMDHLVVGGRGLLSCRPAASWRQVRRRRAGIRVHAHRHRHHHRACPSGIVAVRALVVAVWDRHPPRPRRRAGGGGREVRWPGGSTRQTGRHVRE
jgi:acetylornithine deacetylase/succinyl-diaminopimelate desuccinylase-like protein